ncbi:MAG: thiol:disulfide interchange protein DsbA/DsbL, partial [Pseudomonadota bacterium]
ASNAAESAAASAAATEKAVEATADAAEAAKTAVTDAAQDAAEKAGDTAQDLTLTIEEARARAASNDRLARLDGTPKPMRTASAANPALVSAGDKQFKAGKDYTVLKPAKRTSSPAGKVELTEVFMYQCPHCFSFEPFIESVTKNQPEEMNFVRLPAIFNPVAKLHAQAFYAAESMGVWEELHTPFFQEIHTRRNLMPTEDKLLDFVESQGVDRAAFRSAMKSFEVDSKVRDAMDLNSAYQIGSVPTLVINGKYVTSGSMVGNTQKLRDVVNYLIAKEALAL